MNDADINHVNYKRTNFAVFHKSPMLEFRVKDMTTVLRSVACSTFNNFKSSKGMRTKFTVFES